LVLRLCFFFASALLRSRKIYGDGMDGQTNGWMDGHCTTRKERKTEYIDRIQSAPQLFSRWTEPPLECPPGWHSESCTCQSRWVSVSPRCRWAPTPATGRLRWSPLDSPGSARLQLLSEQVLPVTHPQLLSCAPAMTISRIGGPPLSGRSCNCRGPTPESAVQRVSKPWIHEIEE
jgi:hypothetical protein